MTRERRIEAAAKVLEEFDLFALESFGEWEVAAKALLKAAFPELMSEPPTGWLAPMEATAGMEAAADYWAFGLAYERARDAHTKEQTEDATPTILHTGLVWATPHTKEQT